MSYLDEKFSSSYREEKMSRSYEEQSGFTSYDRDDDQMVIMSSSGRCDSKLSYGNEFSSPNRIPRGMALDLSLAAEAKQMSRSKDEPDIQEEMLTLVFDLPDGSQGENTFKLGHTVEFVKSYVESEFGIPMMEQTLFLEDKVLQNPFSLLDYPEVKGCDEVYVRVEGNLPKHSRK